MSVPFELEALSRGRQYQRWLADTVIPHLGNRILEVGAGIGNLSQWLPMRERLILTEADESLLPRLRSTLEGKYEMPPFPEIRQVDLSEPWEEGFASDDIDTIVSFNVLEHVEDDAQAVKRQLGLLRRSRAPGPKRWIAVVPAHPWAYGSVDRAFGHHRRYSRSAIRRLVEPCGPDIRLWMRHFNLAGLPGWWLMGKVLRKQGIGDSAILGFEKLCPWIRGVDDALHESLHLPLGQSLLCVAEIP